MIARLLEIVRAVSLTRQSFRNWMRVGIVAGIASPSALPPRSGLDSLANVRLRFVTRLGPVLETEAGNASPIVEVFRDGEYDVPLDWDHLSNIVDVGAHVGSFALWAATRAPHAQIIAVEPEPRNAADLRRNVTTNGLDSRVTCIEAAVAAEPGRLSLHVPPHRDTTSSQALEGRVVEVTAVSLPELLQASGGHADLVKLDCEGAEWAVLASLRESDWRSFDALILECHASGEQTIESMEALLRREGLSVDVVDRCPSGVLWYEEIAVLLARRV